MTLTVVTVVLLGGVNIFGGSGSIPGVVLALFAVAVMQNALRLANVTVEVQSIALGLLLIVSVVIPSFAHQAKSAVDRVRGGRPPPADSIPAGAHFRLDPTLDLSKLSLPPLTRLIAQAAQRYGLIVTDRTNWMVGIGAESGVPYVGPSAPDPYKAYMGTKTANQILDAFPWSRLQLVKMTLNP